MKLSDDIQSPRVLHCKGALFLLVALMAAVELFFQAPELTTALLIAALIWGACRFYYYLFYVLEHYAGRDRKYAGLLDEIRHLLRRRN